MKSKDIFNFGNSLPKISPPRNYAKILKLAAAYLVFLLRIIHFSP